MASLIDTLLDPKFGFLIQHLPSETKHLLSRVDKKLAERVFNVTERLAIFPNNPLWYWRGEEPIHFSKVIPPTILKDIFCRYPNVTELTLGPSKEKPEINFGCFELNYV